ncbi:heterokaryon incompatibility protein-domain-containing protein [Coniochaeta sp. 2T2.1]|nr:heterokaryon incompatibility protein-domain-containing protein [Coniochaeta sp. 2T2.1]
MLAAEKHRSTHMAPIGIGIAFFVTQLTEIKLPGAYNPTEPPPKYAALSYTWGDTAVTVPLICNGMEMQITQNLSEALHMTLRVNPYEFLWVDQICINQEDNAEKAGQVKRMALIYHRAQTVLAWIGPEEHDTGLAVEWIEKVASLTKGFGNDVFRDNNNSEDRRKVETVENLSSIQSDDLGVPFSNDEAWRAFSSFYDRPWFQRFWVVQEALPAREAQVVCGSHSVDWHALKAAAAWYTFKAGLIQPRYDSTRQIDGIKYTRAMNLPWSFRLGSEFLAGLLGQNVRPVYRWNFESLLTTFRGRLAGDARDKVFALLGISTLASNAEDGEQESPLLQPNYDKSVMEVYRDATRGLIESDSRFHGALAILKHAVPRSAEPGWPSWVPDWRITDMSDVGYALPAYDGRVGNRAEHRCVAPGPGEDNQLHVEGHILGKVVHRSEYHHISDLIMNIRAQRDECRSVYSERFSTDKYLHTPDNVDTAWAMSLQGGQLQKGFAAKETTPAQYGEILVDILETMMLPRVTPEQEKHRQELINPYMNDYGLDPDWLEYCRLRYCERRWFVTEEGHIGIGNWKMEEGDMVALLWGLDVACVLRPVLGKPDAYEFVGEAYCHGAQGAVEGLGKDGEGKSLGTKMVLV